MKLIFTAAAMLMAGSAIQPPPGPAPAVTQESRAPDVIYVPTPPEVVEAMLDMAQVKDGDVLYDLGSGDGRIPIAAVKRARVKATGIDIDPQRIAEANANAKAQGVEGKVTFRQADLFASDFSDASVVTLYLLDTLNEKLRPKLLAELKPGTRIVSHAFRMGAWEPDKTQDVNGRTIYFWTVPRKGEKPKGL
ncbi:class I SAM-dependent methyltransferase [Sphingomonas koreensis]|jgi:SAM-dependent methyltransferase|uniref:SAM-dependent methyltransferase n=1 Tax=Sphingomonas koreensis TaxID=93064 RepID=A0A1L6J9X8_9SPHN|nr:class I SAM-dependent methyltransferase [Sphingomonas koreensis]APR52657.1 SAM-dependent methyltransferase [Sphingomonas koreensis]MDC7812510.1 class I SAM-dependent methyltransferase [Sphingomonas koreensis]PJI87783.1 methyltransferase family protein [Sphingomonas koreensis]RSU18323.1 class I SAM-dependent methyltransferase [Sphingomonas koreensis]RSU28519.1 class I SAM-dependent methyltransferase [Sphingomonas koreensis]